MDLADQTPLVCQLVWCDLPGSAIDHHKVRGEIGGRPQRIVASKGLVLSIVICLKGF